MPSEIVISDDFKAEYTCDTFGIRRSEATHYMLVRPPIAPPEPSGVHGKENAS